MTDTDRANESPQGPFWNFEVRGDPLELTEAKALQRDEEAKIAPRHRFISWATLRDWLRKGKLDA